MERVYVNGVGIFPFESSEQLIEYVAVNPAILIALNAGKIDRSTTEMKHVINNNIGYCDGVAATFALKKKGLKRPIITGCDLWLKIVQRFQNEKAIYLIGGKQEVIEGVINKLHSDFPKINILGFRNGYIKNAEERKAVIKDIEDKKPDIIFVAMGSPAQEELMKDMQAVYSNAIYQGLGGSFDVYMGKVTRAPLWTQKTHTEGLYRAITRFSDKNIRKRFFNDLWFMIRLFLGFVK